MPRNATTVTSYIASSASKIGSYWTRTAQCATLTSKLGELRESSRRSSTLSGSSVRTARQWSDYQRLKSTKLNAVKSYATVLLVKSHSKTLNTTRSSHSKASSTYATTFASRWLSSINCARKEAISTVSSFTRPLFPVVVNCRTLLIKKLPSNPRTRTSTAHVEPKDSEQLASLQIIEAPMLILAII